MSRAQRQARRAAERALERKKRKEAKAQKEPVRTRSPKAHCPDCKHVFQKGDEAHQCKGCSQVVCVGCVTRGNHKCPGYNLSRMLR